MTCSAGAAISHSLSEFAKDVIDGLSQRPRRLASKYFYDEQGDELFRAIMDMPEYYLTNAEMNIFETQQEQIRLALGDKPFNLVELGAGDGSKTKVLLRHFLDKGMDFVYRPVDISGHVLKLLSEDLRENLPSLKIAPEEGDYFSALSSLSARVEGPKVILFLGANIGNYTPAEARAFIHSLKDKMNEGDYLLIGFDLKKDPQVILDAYNDARGITAEFNLNLLRRMNRELGTNFNLDNWKHWETYDPISGAAKSHLISLCDQEVKSELIDQSWFFPAWEPIHTEVSWKYSLEDIKELAEDCGFEVKTSFFDQHNFFVDSLWQLT